jgi:hypothetical protein
MQRCLEPSGVGSKGQNTTSPQENSTASTIHRQGSQPSTTLGKDMAPAENTPTKSTTSEDGSWLLVNPTATSSEVSYVISEAGSSSQPYIITPRRNHPRSPGAELDPDQPESCRATRGTASTTNRTSETQAHETARAELTPPPSPSAAAQTGNMPRRHNASGFAEGSTSASRQPPSPGAARGSRPGSSAGRRRDGEGSSAQDLSLPSGAATVGSSGSARREGPTGGGSTTRYASGSGSGSGSGAGSSSSAERAGNGGSGLTEGNVSRVSEFYERVRRERDREEGSEPAQSRADATRAELAKIQGKLREGK